MLCWVLQVPVWNAQVSISTLKRCKSSQAIRLNMSSVKLKMPQEQPETTKMIKNGKCSQGFLFVKGNGARISGVKDR